MADMFVNRHAVAGIDTKVVFKKDLEGTAPGIEGVPKWMAVNFAVENMGPVELLLHGGSLKTLIEVLQKGLEKLRTEPEVLYTGLFLTPEFKGALLEAYPAFHPRLHADHVTVVFRPDEAMRFLLEPQIGKEFPIVVTGAAADEKGQVVGVKIPSFLQHGDQRPHVTISCAVNTAPVYSNQLLDKLVEVAPLKLVGVLRHFMSK
jgi:hypothetical protein